MNKNRVFSWLMAIVLSFGMLLTPLTADAAPQSVDPRSGQGGISMKRWMQN